MGPRGGGGVRMMIVGFNKLLFPTIRFGSSLHFRCDFVAIDLNLL